MANANAFARGTASARAVRTFRRNTVYRYAEHRAGRTGIARPIQRTTRDSRGHAHSRTPKRSAPSNELAEARRSPSLVAPAQAVENVPEPDSFGTPRPAASCSIDDLDGCSLADLEMMYVDALWDYYNPSESRDEDSFARLTDEMYDQLRDELSWQGSGFPTLRRHEIAFVKAAISYARGTPVVSDEEYEELKQRVKGDGKRKDVTALLLYVKGQELLDQYQYREMREEMEKLGIEVKATNIACTLARVPDTLNNDVGRVLWMYAGLSIFPTAAAALVPIAVYLTQQWTGVTFPLDDALPLGSLLFTLTVGAIAGNRLVYYTGLNDATIVTGQCPCCETEFTYLWAGGNGGGKGSGWTGFFPEGGDAAPEPPKQVEHQCAECSTVSILDRETMKLRPKEAEGSTAKGIGFVDRAFRSG